MSGLPPDPPRLRTLPTWHAMWVQRRDDAITAAERREAERIRAEKARLGRVVYPLRVVAKAKSGCSGPSAAAAHRSVDRVEMGGVHVSGVSCEWQ